MLLLELHRVTRSYSSRPFLCALDYIICSTSFHISLTLLLMQYPRKLDCDSCERQPGRTADSLCYLPKMLQVKTLHAKLCSDLAYVYSCQSSCVLVGQMAPFHEKICCNHDTTCVDCKVTNLTCIACVQ